MVWTLNIILLFNPIDSEMSISIPTPQNPRCPESSPVPAVCEYDLNFCPEVKLELEDNYDTLSDPGSCFDMLAFHPEQDESFADTIYTIYFGPCQTRTCPHFAVLSTKSSFET